jgi:hypothetical protein
VINLSSGTVVTAVFSVPTVTAMHWQNMTAAGGRVAIDPYVAT